MSDLFPFFPPNPRCPAGVIKMLNNEDFVIIRAIWSSSSWLKMIKKFPLPHTSTIICHLYSAHSRNIGACWFMWVSAPVESCLLVFRRMCGPGWPCVLKDNRLQKCLVCFLSCASLCCHEQNLIKALWRLTSAVKLKAKYSAQILWLIVC